jgi:hypothetical protein
MFFNVFLYRFIIYAVENALLNNEIKRWKGQLILNSRRRIILENQDHILGDRNYLNGQTTEFKIWKKGNRI